ncbi:MAG: FMN-binding protein [Candidatus Saccharibacteria bacterium]|nr:FMN-binding protein [Candidatus Saccharibacteria bacterium]
MKKTLFILIVVALLGILAATVVPSAQQKSAVSTTTSTTATSAPTSSTAATTATPTTTTTTTGTTTSGQYKDGKYTGTTGSSYYDEIQVAVVISGGKITSISTPILNGDSSRSDEINNYAIPELKNQTISAQNASIDGVSGASETTRAYENSLQSALDQAKA